MRVALVALAAIALTACDDDRKPASEHVKNDNPDYRVQRLFSVDGCDVYRFDDGRRVYFTNCKGSAQTEYTEHCGKGCQRTVTVTDSTALLPPPALPEEQWITGQRK